MRQANPLWGAPRIHGELLKLGIAVAQSTVAKYLSRPRKQPSQSGRTFLTNHLAQTAAIDFFTVPTATFRVLFVFVVLRHERRRDGIAIAQHISRHLVPGKRFPHLLHGPLFREGERSGGDVESRSRAGRPRGCTAEGGTSRCETQRDELDDAAALVIAEIEETLFYYAFPREHWRCLRTNNPLERILREVRRRTRAVGAFPDGKSALMLAAARLRHVAGTKWGTRRYLDMNRLAEASEAA
jgi:hypothetical protein